MSNKINVAKLLKDCPVGMELDCTMFDNATFARVDNNRETFPIEIKVGGLPIMYLTKEGCFYDTTLLPESKCVIFPKGKTTWEGFVSPSTFKDGDIVVTEDTESFQMFILKEVEYHENDSYLGWCYFGWDFDSNELFCEDTWGFNRLATEEEKEKLFKTLKDNGYVWNPTTKTLEKLVTIFKVGDKIKLKNAYAKKYDDFNTREITDIKYSHYILDDKQAMPLSNQYLYELVSDKVDITSLKLHTGDVVKHKQSGVYCTVEEYAEGLKGHHTSIGLLIPDNKADEWEIMPDKFNADKFDITTLKPFEQVLVRNVNGQVWTANFFSHVIDTNPKLPITFVCVGGSCPNQCIPFKGNEYLRGKTDDCSDFYKTWE